MALAVASRTLGCSERAIQQARLTANTADCTTVSARAARRAPVAALAAIQVPREWSRRNAGAPPTPFNVSVPGRPLEGPVGGARGSCGTRWSFAHGCLFSGALDAASGQMGVCASALVPEPIRDILAIEDRSLARYTVRRPHEDAPRDTLAWQITRSLRSVDSLPPVKLLLERLRVASDPELVEVFLQDLWAWSIERAFPRMSGESVGLGQGRVLRDRVGLWGRFRCVRPV